MDALEPPLAEVAVPIFPSRVHSELLDFQEGCTKRTLEKEGVMPGHCRQGSCTSGIDSGGLRRGVLQAARWRRQDTVGGSDGEEDRGIPRHVPDATPRCHVESSP
jgi:hypothetical protein